ncbi:phosphatidylglycerol lysyltransferase domain-containing protein [Streptacidiphilus jiangxiensis]|uniref:Lysyl-tRNA synthetase, class 2 n=1 Tax=Streptacidiphilus jiangxiensis TaxID=235985 RepID=A0A1H7X0B4_STRJI|nr:phosphatidylglycerol lysyltransferase domain-containing protein [Streptacidiphilus jiangxiensis]SEM27081.1 lysyl-tRNA synthetase, class 2 [Streptacidiphilus jiangxiensis]
MSSTATTFDKVTHVSARTAVWYLRIVACLNLFAAVSLSFREQVRHHNAGDFYTPYLLTAGFSSAAFAVFMAVMMNRHKRAAWIANAVLSGLLTIALVLSLIEQPGVRAHWFNWATLGVLVLFGAALLLGRAEFRAKGDPTNPRLAAGVLVGGGLVTLLVGTGLLSLTEAGRGATLGDRVEYVIYRAITLNSAGSQFFEVAVPRWIDVTVNGLSVAVLVLVTYALFRAPKGKEYLGPEDEARLRGLLDRHGARDSLGYFALRRDKSVVFSPSGKAAVTYRVVGGVSLASGDPIGDVEAWPGAIEKWLEQAREHAWTPAVTGASEEAGVVYARHGLDALELGDEAIVEVADFSLEGRSMRGVRQAHNRVRRAGYTVAVRRHADIGEAEMDAMIVHADRWRDGGTERGWSMALGRLGDPDDGQCVMLECKDADGELKALLSFVPWGEHGLSLDLMRRDRDSDNGLMEFMVIELLQQARSIGVERVSLNFAVFRAVFERGGKLGAGPFLRAWRSVLVFFSRWWQIESLYRANAKYRPQWEPRYVLFERSRDLPRIALANACVEGFIAQPRLPALPRGKRRSAAHRPEQERELQHVA